MDTSHGWAAVTSAAPKAVALLFVVALVLLHAGCNTDPMNPFTELLDDSEPRVGSIHDDGEYATSPLEPELLDSDDWFEKPPASYAQRSRDSRRWHHQALDRYLHPSAPRRDLAEELASASPVVATNAAIVTAHWRSGTPIEHLTAAVRAEQLPLPVRSAAAEALGFLEKPSPAPALRELLSELSSPVNPPPDDDKRPNRPANLDLQADLMRALARHAEPGDEKWFNAALGSRAWQVRLEGVAGWMALSDLSLPAAAIELRADRDPRVRATAVRTIAAHRGPRTVDLLKQALQDADPDVRTAAMSALAGIGTADARALLAGMRENAVDLGQAAVAATQSAQDLRDDVQATAGDAQLQLRLAVAETLEQAEQQGRELAAETAASTQDAVRQATAQFATVADATSQRIGQMRQLVAELREGELTDAARREAAAALERWAMDADAAVRQQAAGAMGQLADPVYLPILMAMLSDESDVQLAAMASLVAIAGTDVAAGTEDRPLTSEDKVRMWQLWYRERQNKSP